MLNDWATVQYMSYHEPEEPEGEEAEKQQKKIPHEIFRDEHIVFLVGNYQVSKCWDIAI